ncbi:MAG: Omp28-related outer membrane protein [Ignavibacteria bacterium]
MKNLFGMFIITITLLTAMSVNLQASPRNVLIEYITGTWCGNCPCGHQTLNTINSQYPQTIVLSYHAFSNDPWKVFNGNQIISLLNLSATPTAVIDRNTTVSNSDYSQWISAVQNRYVSSSETKINVSVVSKSYNAASRNLDLTINATALENLTGQYKINFVILENNLIYPQAVYAQCGTAGVIPDYVHKNVVRNMVNSATGEELNTGNTWNANEVFSKSMFTSINTGWNAQNCEVVAFVYKVNSPLAAATVEQAIKESVSGTLGITGNDPENIDSYSLSQNYPNPFNPETNIKFTVPVNGNVSFKVFNMLGKEVATYVNGYLQKGSYNVSIDGSALSSGVYFYQLKTTDFKETKRMILIK